MKILQTKISDKEKSFKYELVLDDKVLGYGYIINRAINPIEVYIGQQYQSNGYGKVLFNGLLELLRQRHIKGTVFELKDEQYKFQNIILQAGAIQVSRNGSIVKYILKIN